MKMGVDYYPEHWEQDRKMEIISTQDEKGTGASRGSNPAPFRFP
ncbi:hypothetical protein [Alkalihalobacillus hemicellulosilyticus]|nr:hypothetical protein [Halalkalibacter hemicellulosilyticus]